jgi:hypothetical protein
MSPSIGELESILMDNVRRDKDPALYAFYALRWLSHYSNTLPPVG